MRSMDRTFNLWSVLQRRYTLTTEAKKAGQRGLRRYRLTLAFVFTALVVTAVASIVVNLVIGDLAEANLNRIAEENTARDTVHILSMMRMMEPMVDQHPMDGMSSAEATDSGNAMQHGQQPMPLTLEFLASPEGLSRSYPMLVEVDPKIRTGG